MEWNPDHKVTQQMRDQWHKVVALILLKQGLKEMEFTIEDVEKLGKGDVNIVIEDQCKGPRGVLVVRIVDDRTAAELLLREEEKLKRKRLRDN